MIATPTWATIPALGSTASKNVTGLDQSALYTAGNLFPAEHLNQFTYWFANNNNVSQTAVTALLTENQNSVTATGQAITPADNFQQIKTIIAFSNPVGTLINSEIKLTPAIWTSGSATYLPVIARWDADHDVTSTQAPDLVTKYRAESVTINVGGTAVSSWTGTVAGSVVTISSGTTGAALALCTMLANESIANGFIQTQATGGSGAITPLYTGSAQRCINISGTDYAITAVNTGGLTVTVSGTPATGTVIVYPYRVAGSSTSVRLPRLSGFIGVSQYDYDGVYVAGFRKMDQLQNHYHNRNASAASEVVRTGSGTFGFTATGSQAETLLTTTGSPTTDTVNGIPRVGKVTAPQTYALYPYTWAGRLLA